MVKCLKNKVHFGFRIWKAVVCYNLNMHWHPNIVFLSVDAFYFQVKQNLIVYWKYISILKMYVCIKCIKENYKSTFNSFEVSTTRILHLREAMLTRICIIQRTYVIVLSKSWGVCRPMQICRVIYSIPCYSWIDFLLFQSHQSSYC